MPDEPRMKVPSLARNLLSSIGLVIALIALVNIAFLVFVDVGAEHSNPYVGIFAYVVMPGILCGGLALFFGGMLLERRRRRRRSPEEVPAYPDINLNDNRVRRMVGLSIVGIVLFVLVSVVGSYKAYHYTETDQFCGTTCHTIMHPEYTAYKASPHARVGCVNCHIGSGATWYVKSKMSGAYQLYATAVNNYPRPILTPVANLRPAQETCEQCHWPEKFWGAQMKVFNHFGYDEGNTPRETRLLINVGGGSATSGLSSGIHWHMNIGREISYVATDRQRQQIPYVRSVDKKTGKVTEYFLEGTAAADHQKLKANEARRMDCVDCHNRPTHIYQPPDHAVDVALLANDINRTLPFIKQQAVEILSRNYTSTDQAVKVIAAEIPAYYAKNYPEVAATRKADINRAVSQVQTIFKTIRFPEMKVDWRTHPNNVGHFYSTGCFRCHDDQHVSSDGKRISKDCNICHTMVSQSESGAVMAQSKPIDFQHPVDMGDLRALSCNECHTGGSM
jgi:nitrate/TMAO reductase-like tetraheme cytochrome c subunit